MTIEQVKVWLERGRGLYREIEILKEAREKAEYKAQGIKIGVSDDTKIAEVAKSRDDKKLIALVNTSLELDKQIAKLDEILAEISIVINKVEDAQLRTLLTSRYILNKNWIEIGELMTFSSDYVRKSMHTKALYSASDIICQ